MKARMTFEHCNGLEKLNLSSADFMFLYLQGMFGIKLSNLEMQKPYNLSHNEKV